MSSRSDIQEVFLTMPALPEFLRVARVTASGLASQLGFSIDEVDDLRLALDELCFAIMNKDDDGGQLHLTYSIETDKLVINGNAPRASLAGPIVLGDLSKQILTALVDDHRIWDDSGNARFVLTKQTSRP